MLTFLFTDIEGSTEKWRRFGEAMGAALAEHDRLITGLVAEYKGKIIKHTGDGFFAVFEDTETPMKCAIEIEKMIASHDWGKVDELRVRVSLNSGDAERRGEDYFGSAVNRTARLLTAGWGGQILLTPDAVKTCKLPQKAVLKNLGVHILKDLAEPQEIYGLVHPDLGIKDFPALRSLDSRPNNLPPQATPFVGREPELKEIARLIRNSSTRLLTLLGPGGIGKTRIALQAAAERIEDYPHGVYFVALAPLASAEFIVPAIAKALKLTFYSSDDPKEQLLEFLKDKELLLVMDNFEHLMSTTGIVTDVLRTAPRVKVMATSRERLNLQGEWIFEVGGMRYPGAIGAGDLETYSALELFAQSARRSAPDFELTSENEQQVIQVTRLVDGMPLAIELAASWLRTLSLEDIIEEVRKSFDFLETSLKDIPERHRSLRGVFEYSWKLLSADEQRVLGKLSVFAGGFTREAAQKVADASVFILSSLVDKSLVRKTAEGTYEMHEAVRKIAMNRYDMHEVVRQYAGAKLAENAKERSKTLELHALYYAGFLADACAKMKGDTRIDAYTSILVELENVRATWEWGIEHASDDVFEKGFEGLSHFYERQGLYREALNAFGRAAEVVKDRKISLYMNLRYNVATFTYRISRFEKAFDGFNECLGLAKRLDDKPRVASSLYSLGACSFRLGDFAKAKTMFTESLALETELGNRKAVAKATFALGDVCNALLEFSQAIKLCTEALKLQKELGDKGGMTDTLITLSNTCLRAGDSEAARKWSTLSVKLAEERGDKHGIALSNACLADSLLDLGEIEDARVAYKRSFEIFTEMGTVWGTIVALAGMGNVAMSGGDYAEAERHFTESLSRSREIKHSDGIIQGLNRLADIALEKGDLKKARELYAESLKESEVFAEKLGLSACLKGLGKVSAAEGKFEQAGSFLVRALKTVMEIDKTSETLDVMVDIAELALTKGDTERAAEILDTVTKNLAAGEGIRKRAAKLLSGLKPPSVPKTFEDLVKEILG